MTASPHGFRLTSGTLTLASIISAALTAVMVATIQSRRRAAWETRPTSERSLAQFAVTELENLRAENSTLRAENRMLREQLERPAARRPLRAKPAPSDPGGRSTG